MERLIHVKKPPLKIQIGSKKLSINGNSYKMLMDMMDMEGDSGSSNAVKQPQGKKVPKEDYRDWVCPHCGYCCSRTKSNGHLFHRETFLQRIRKHVCKKSDGDVKVSPKYELKDDSTNNKIDSS